jgi:hypothetical protein
MSRLPDDYDSAWKDALEAFFPQFMDLLWPDMHARIDWSRKPEFLDKELQALLRSRARGRRHVDKLVAARLLDGVDALVRIHVEIQGEHEKGFPGRIYEYHGRLRERYPGRPLVSLAVLTASRGRSSVMRYQYEYWGCRLDFTFPVFHLENWRERMDELWALAPRNPFAVVILAQLEANAARGDRQRLARKTALVRLLYHYAYSRDDVVRLFRVSDAMIALPEALAPEFEDAVVKIEEETQKMAYVTSIERLGIKRGREQGLKEGLNQGGAALLSRLLARKFGPLPAAAQQRIASASSDNLDDWALNLLTAASLDEVFGG